MGDRRFMELAMAKAAEGMEKGQTPFGACIVRDGEVLALCHNRVWETTDITAHAEIVAIREACAKLGELDLSGSVIYSTTEPCPMCFAAIHWAKIDKIIYGAEIADARAAGFNELSLSNRDMKKQGGSPVEIEGGLLREENRALFRKWLDSENSRSY